MKKSITIASLAIAAFSHGASANFVNEASNPLGVGATKNHVSIVGSPSRHPTSHGFGKDVSLTDALGQIVPREYSIRTFGVADATRVSWQGGKNWVSVLAEATGQVNGLQIEIDHGQRTVTAHVNASAKSNKAFGQAPWTWEIRTSDGKISQALRRWGEEGGYQFIWESPKDFPVMANATFTGSFQDALKAVIESLAHTDSPVMATFYANNVVRVERFNGQASDLGGR